MGRCHIVVQALRDVQQTLAGNGISPQESFEIVERGLVAVHLLRRHNRIEPHFQLGRRVGEQVVVDVGKHGQFVAGMQPLQPGNGVAERLPLPNGFRETVGFVVAHLEAQLAREVANHAGQHFAISAIVPACWRGSNSEYSARIRASLMSQPLP